MESLQQTEDDVLDLREIFWRVLEPVLGNCFSGVLVCMCALIYTKVTTEPLYTSSTKIYVLNKGEDNSDVTNSDLQLGRSAGF